MITQFRKRPVVIEAIQLTPSSLSAVEEFVGGDLEIRAGGVVIATLEGAMHASVGDWIIRGVRGEFYPCKPDIFEATYDAEKNLKAVDANDEKSFAELEKQFREARENERAFQAELAAVINKYSREGRSNTPDFILARYLVNCLEAYEAATEWRTEWADG